MLCVNYLYGLFGERVSVEFSKCYIDWFAFVSGVVLQILCFCSFVLVLILKHSRYCFIAIICNNNDSDHYGYYKNYVITDSDHDKY